MRNSGFGVTGFTISLALLFSLCAAVSTASAEYPERPINMVVPYPPGGITDLAARALADAMEKQLNKPVVVVNKAGGSTTVGGNAVATAKPDGCTLGFFPSAASMPEVYTYFYQAPYSGKDFRPVAKAAIPVLTISVKADSPMNSVKDFVAYARQNPGVKVGLHGKATQGYLVMRTIAKNENVNIVEVPLDGDAQIVPAILGGHIPVGTPAYPAVKSLADAKEIKILTLLTEKRVDFAPNLPCLSEAGFKQPAGTFLGVFAPKDTPDAIIKILNDTIAKIAQQPDFRMKVHGMGIQVDFEESKSFAKSIEQYTANLQAFFKEEGLVK
jgi:tripartite-type tricarboxylate transporter receptor subunit TctC